MFSSIPFVTVRWDLSNSYFHSIYKHLIIRLTARSRCVPAVHGLVRFLSSLVVEVECSTMLDIFVHCCGRGLLDHWREMRRVSRLHWKWVWLIILLCRLSAGRGECTWIHCSWIFQHLERVPTHDRPLPMTNSSSIWVSAVCIYKALWASSAPANPTCELHPSERGWKLGSNC